MTRPGLSRRSGPSSRRSSCSARSPAWWPAGRPGWTAPSARRPSAPAERVFGAVRPPITACMSRHPPSPASLTIDGESLSLADAGRILDGEVAELRLAPAARRAIERSRGCVLALLDRGERIYGVNTGFGKLANQRIEPHEVLHLQ